MSKRRRRVLLLGLAVALGLVAAWLGSSYAVAYRLTRRARPPYEEPPPSLSWGRIQPVRLSTADGEALGAWYIEGEPKRPLVILFHGNGGSRTACLREAQLASKVGCSVVLVTLRAHGDSTGQLNNFGLSARHDVIAAVTWAEEHCPGKTVVVWGQSIGSAAAIFASEELKTRVRGYILECPYRDLRTLVRNRTRIYLPPVLDQIAYSGLLVTAPVVLPEFQRVSPLDAVSGIPNESRVLVLSGTADQRARPDKARVIHEGIKAPARWVEIEHGDHLELAAADEVAYTEAVVGFLKECQKPEPNDEE